MEFFLEVISPASKSQCWQACDFGGFLIFNCAIKNAFFRVRAEILLSRVIAPRESCAGPVLGVVHKYNFLEKYSPLS